MSGGRSGVAKTSVQPAMRRSLSSLEQSSASSARASEPPTEIESTATANRPPKRRRRVLTGPPRCRNQRPSNNLLRSEPQIRRTVGAGAIAPSRRDRTGKKRARLAGHPIGCKTDPLLGCEIQALEAARHTLERPHRVTSVARPEIDRIGHDIEAGLPK